MSMEIIRHGGCVKEAKVFLCRECRCVFKTDEYKVERENGDGPHRVAVCPDCEKQVTRYD